PLDRRPSARRMVYQSSSPAAPAGRGEVADLVEALDRVGAGHVDGRELPYERHQRERVCLGLAYLHQVARLAELPVPGPARGAEALPHVEHRGLGLEEIGRAHV